jgi:hypothetical protein
MNVILRAVKHKRPAVSPADPSNFHEKNFHRLQLRQMIGYLEDIGEVPTEEENKVVEEYTHRALNILYPDTD